MHWIGGWVGPRVGLDDVERRKTLLLLGLELQPLRQPARSQSLYRLNSPGSGSSYLPHVIRVLIFLGVRAIKINISFLYPEWSKTRRCFIATAFQLCFRICHQESPRKPGGTEIRWDTSAAGLC
jgi:hypothetical protein